MGGGKGKKKKGSQPQENARQRGDSSKVKAEATPYEGLDDEMEDLDIGEDSDSAEPVVKGKPKGKENVYQLALDHIDSGGSDDGMSSSIPTEEKKMSRKEMKKQRKKV